MRLENSETSKAKERIIAASIKPFSRRGLEARSVNKIADAAKVTKALIYCYFKSKEEILNHVNHSVSVTGDKIAMDFIHSSILQMIHDGRLDIEPDRLHFIDDASVRLFMEMCDVQSTSTQGTIWRGAKPGESNSEIVRSLFGKGFTRRGRGPPSSGRVFTVLARRGIPLAISRLEN